MVKFQLSYPAAPLDYPTLGFIATADGAILDGTLFTPDLEIPPDARWSVYGGGSAETSINRYATPSVDYLNPIPEVTAGYLLAYDTDANTYVPTSPTDVLETEAWASSLSASLGAIATPIAEAVAGRGGLVGFLGDSITKGGDNNSATRRDNSPSMHAMLSSDGRWELWVNAGVNGDDSAEMLARVQTAIITPGCNVCVLMFGANDNAGSMPIATQRANLAAIHAALTAAGVQLVLCTTSPENNNVAKTQQTNAMIKAYAAENGLAVADVWAVLAANDGTWESGYNDGGGADPTHPDEPARSLYGPVIDAALRAVIPAGERVRLVQSTADGLDILQGAGMFTGAQNGGLQGFGAQPWDHLEGEEAFGVATYSVSEGIPPVRGKWQKCEFNSSAYGHNLNVEKSSSAGPGFAVGDTLLFSGRYKSDGTPAGNAILQFQTSGGSTISELYAFRAVEGRMAASDGVFAIRGTVPATCTKIRVILGYSDAAVEEGYAQFAQVGVFNTSRTV